jgi:O-methyltransferase
VDKASDLYLELLARTLTRAVTEDNDRIAGQRSGMDKYKPGERVVARLLQRGGYQLVKRRPYDAQLRQNGRDWPARAETMVGLKRLDNVKRCIETVLADRVPGDLLEAGVWRGGTGIFMRGVLKARDVTDRLVWLADSFQGLPPADLDEYPHESPDDFSTFPELAVSIEEVRHNFERYGLLDDQVRFLPGWFRDTLPGPVGPLAVLRLDGDLYASTIECLDALYPRLSPGGFCIIDDYGNVPACAEAVHDYRARCGIDEPIDDIDEFGAFWRRR